jgi:hypothetical protein
MASLSSRDLNMVLAQTLIFSILKRLLYSTMFQVSETSLFRKELVEPNEKYYVKFPIGAVKAKGYLSKVRRMHGSQEMQSGWSSINFLSLIYCW